MQWDGVSVFYYVFVPKKRAVDTVYQYKVCVYAQIERKHMLYIGKCIEYALSYATIHHLVDTICQYKVCFTLK